MAMTAIRTAAQTGMTELERRLCGHTGAAYCVAVGSAAAGLLLALKAAGIREGAGVLTAGLCGIAAGEIIRLAGGNPIFVDVNPSTYCVDPHSLDYVIARRVRRGLPVPRALVAADLFGSPADYEALEAVCERYGVLLIEDMAGGFGASRVGRRAGSFGHMAVASLFPGASPGEGMEGGAVFCRSGEDWELLRSLRRALDPGEDRLEPVQANVAAERLSALMPELMRRRAVAGRYEERLSGAVRLQRIPEDGKSARTHFAIALPSTRLREEVIGELRLCRVPCGVPEPVPPGREGFSPDRVALVNARFVAERLLLLPMHPYLSRHVVDYVCDRVLEGVTAPEAGEINFA